MPLSNGGFYQQQQKLTVCYLVTCWLLLALCNRAPGEGVCDYLWRFNVIEHSSRRRNLYLFLYCIEQKRVHLESFQVLVAFSEALRRPGSGITTTTAASACWSNVHSWGNYWNACEGGISWILDFPWQILSNKFHLSNLIQGCCDCNWTLLQTQCQLWLWKRNCGNWIAFRYFYGIVSRQGFVD